MSRRIRIKHLHELSFDEVLSLPDELHLTTDNCTEKPDGIFCELGLVHDISCDIFTRTTALQHPVVTPADYIAALSENHRKNLMLKEMFIFHHLLDRNFYHTIKTIIKPELERKFTADIFLRNLVELNETTFKTYGTNYDLDYLGQHATIVIHSQSGNLNLERTNPNWDPIDPSILIFDDKIEIDKKLDLGELKEKIALDIEPELFKMRKNSKYRAEKFCNEQKFENYLLDLETKFIEVFESMNWKSKFSNNQAEGFIVHLPNLKFKLTSPKFKEYMKNVKVI